MQCGIQVSIGLCVYILHICKLNCGRVTRWGQFLRVPCTFIEDPHRALLVQRHYWKRCSLPSARRQSSAWISSLSVSASGGRFSACLVICKRSRCNRRHNATIRQQEIGKMGQCEDYVWIASELTSPDANAWQETHAHITKDTSLQCKLDISTEMTEWACHKYTRIEREMSTAWLLSSHCLTFDCSLLESTKHLIVNSHAGLGSTEQRQLARYSMYQQARHYLTWTLCFARVSSIRHA